uniref:Uncharacterized protein n=1 Tax=Candidatus Kentrum sp. LFY TaxID=2126342 RepID=A0A450VC65_9GAMM|nr:MAG: hypothetical protein BECKLFY1418A_GA0070994_11923 [Candidatus Kentron sp. LFY]
MKKVDFCDKYPYLKDHVLEQGYIKDTLTNDEIADIFATFLDHLYIKSKKLSDCYKRAMKDIFARGIDWGVMLSHIDFLYMELSKGRKNIATREEIQKIQEYMGVLENDMPYGAMNEVIPR